MRPFPQRCMTCDSQFRVTRAELIGTIVACPKCNSMMQIVAPAATAAPPDELDQAAMSLGQGTVDSEAVTEASNILAPGEVDFSADSSTKTAASRSRFEVDESVEAGAPAEAGHEPGDLAPPLAFESVGATRSRQVALVVVTLVSGLCVAGLLFFLFVRSWDRQATADRVAAADALVAGNRLDDADSGAPPSTDEPPVVNATPPVTDVSAETPVTDVTGENQVDEPESNEADISATGENANRGEETAPSPQGDDVEPDDGSPDSIVAGAEITEDEAANARPLEDLPGLDAFKPFLVDLSAPAPDAPAKLERLPARDETLLDAAADGTLDPMMVANPPEPIDTQRSLAIEFAIHRPTAYPLADYLLLVSQLTGISIDVDWVSLDLAGVDVRQAIKVLPKSQPAQDHLTSLSDQIGGLFQEDESLLRLTIPDEAFDRAAAILVATEDFGEQKPAADELLIRFVGETAETPKAVEVDSEAGENAADANPANGVEAIDERVAWVRQRARKQLAIVATESLRRMRELPGQIPDSIMRRWACGPTARADQSYRWPIVDSGKTGKQPITALPMAQWLAQTARGNDASVLVHWTDATRRQMSPSQLVLPHVGDGFLSMTRSTLGPFDVRIRRVDDGYWWVGTDARYDWLSMVVWTKPMDEPELNGFVAKLDQAMIGITPEAYRRVYDPVSGRLLIMLPRFMVRQLDQLME